MPEQKKADLEWLASFAEVPQVVNTESLELVGRFQDMRAIYHALTQHEVRRLKDVEGEDSPEVLEREASLSQNLDVMQRLDVEAELMQIQVPKVEAKDALIHGRITDQKSRGQAGLVAVLTDRDGGKVAGGEVEVDSSGYFALVLDPEKIKRILASKKDVYLSVMNRKGVVCYRRPAPLTLKEGETIAEHIVLSPSEIASAIGKARAEVKKPK